MSELKDYRIPTRSGNVCHCYLKSEADKVIAEKEKEIAELKEQLKNSRNARKYWRKEYLVEYKECRHNKYKRCLAMAEMCESMCYWFAARFDHHELVDNVKWELFDRWRLRWAKLSDKFKEAK